MAKAGEIGMWDQDDRGSGRGLMFVKRTPNTALGTKDRVVRNDWDEDEDDEDEVEPDRDTGAQMDGDKADTSVMLEPRMRVQEGQEQDGEESSKIWEEANKRAPMPELIVGRASTSQSLPHPPPAALRPTLRILKRPSPNTNGNEDRVVSLASLPPCSGHNTGSGRTSPAPRGTLAEREAQYQEARSRIFGERGKQGDASSMVIVRGATDGPDRTVRGCRRRRM